MKIYTKNNFHKHTFCEFVEVNSTELQTVELDFKSKSGSGYCFSEEGVYRISNHWGRAANCRWRLISDVKSPNQKERIGYAKWTDFYPNNDLDQLFYIDVNFDEKEVTFQHKSNPKYDGIAVFRNASETSKIIRQIKELLEGDQWTKHYYFEDIEQARKTTIHQLINTNIPLAKLKMEWKTNE
ncbi:hypothetical protein ACFSX9_00290 [Flavobacterium ardleyense]|uniref:Uncharacterized protein n=1 Tax=Flavobacterium ardleyense TaxID=2038737 RepID=A0ABW5Z4T8_9FLAO